MLRSGLFSGPLGEPYCVLATFAEGERVTYHASESDAWASRDAALDAGAIAVRVLGSPCRGVAIVPDAEPLVIED